jgi:hypothetical protein
MVQSKQVENPIPENRSVSHFILKPITMEKPGNRKNERMNQPVMSITATLKETRLLTKLVERLACHNRGGLGFESKMTNPGWVSIHPSSIEAFVSGDIRLLSGGQFVTRPFIKSFLFTCIYDGTGDYQLTWSASLS